jgi:N-acetylmuramoyl-L-alanine amidase
MSELSWQERDRLQDQRTVDIQWRLATLNQQQAAITRALACMEDGRWMAAESGADSVEGWLLALNPTWTGLLSPRSPLYTRPQPPPIPDEADITWIGSPNRFSGHAGLRVSAIVIHTMAGSLSSCDNWFQNPNAQVSSHFGVGLQGQRHQYVKLQDSSWANGVLESGNGWQHIVGNNQNPNYQTITVETEDKGSGRTPVTDAQFYSTIDVCRVALRFYPTIKYLFGHRIISPNSRPQCCGNRWWESGKFQALADELGLEAYF